MDDTKSGEERFVAEVSPLLTEGFENAEMPDIRVHEATHKGHKFNDWVGSEQSVDVKDLQTLSGVCSKENELIRLRTGRENIEKYIQDNAAALADEEKEVIDPRSIFEQYKDLAPGTIRKQWADKAEKKELTWSGMPTYMQMIVEGKEVEYEIEIFNYCKLAGLRYKTSKEKMKKEIEQIKSDMFSAIWEVERRLDNLFNSYKQLENK